MGKAPSNLVLVGGTWHWRLSVPARLRERVGRCELRRSLGTGLLRKARPLAAMLTYKTRIFWESRAVVDEARFMEALRAKQDEWFTEYEEELFNTPPKKHSVNRDHEIETLRDQLDLVTEHLNEGDFRFSKEVADEALKSIGCTCQEDSIEYKKLCYNALLMMKETHEVFIKKRLEDFLFRPDKISQTPRACF